MRLIGDVICEFCKKNVPYLKNKTPFAYSKFPFRDKVYFCSECNDALNCNTESGVLCIISGCQHLKEIGSLYCGRHDDNSLPLINPEIEDFKPKVE